MPGNLALDLHSLSKVKDTIDQTLSRLNLEIHVSGVNLQIREIVLFRNKVFITLGNRLSKPVHLSFADVAQLPAASVLFYIVLIVVVSGFPVIGGA